MKIIVFLFILQASFFIHAKSLLEEKYPEGLLTRDYGILTEADLLYETKVAKVTPYKSKEIQPAYQRWQCFQTSEILFKYSAWKEVSSDYAKGIAILCDYSFRVTDMAGILGKKEYTVQIL